MIQHFQGILDHKAALISRCDNPKLRSRIELTTHLSLMAKQTFKGNWYMFLKLNFCND